MGRYGQAILTIGGAIIGSYFGYPQLGAALGSLAGSLLFPPKLPTISGPRLADIAQTSSAVGVPIPRVWGTIAVAGTVIHQLDVQEVITSEDTGGKGGPTQEVETASYFQSFAIALADCPEDPIQGIRRIWANGKIIYDKTPRADTESDPAFQSRMVANTRLEQVMTVYFGTGTQLPDPTLEAYYGVSGVSAHLNLAYVVFTDWQNKAEDGNRMPAQWKFEIFTNGSASAGESQEYANEVLYPWSPASETDQVENNKNNHLYEVISNGLYDSPGGTFTSSAAALGDCVELRPVPVGGPDNFMGHWLSGAPYPQRFPGMPGVITHDATHVLLNWNFQPAARALLSPDTGGGECEVQLPFWFTTGPAAEPTPVWTDGVGFFASDSAFRVVITAPPESLGLPSGFDRRINCSSFPNPASAYDYLVTEDYILRVHRLVRAPDNPCTPRGLPTAPCADAECEWCIVDGRIRQNGPWTQECAGPLSWHCMASYTEGVEDGVQVVTQYPLSPVRPSGHAQFDDQQFWEASYAIAVAEHVMPSGLVYGVHYPTSQSCAYARTIATETIEVAPVRVDEIVAALCRESGMTAEQIDVTDLDGLTVNGYCRTRQMSSRAAIDPLRQAKFFDGFESGRKLRFVRRGGPVRRTFTDDELGIVMGEDDNVSRVQTRTAQDVDLPRTVRVHYMSISRDYEPGEQHSPARLETDAVNDVDLELPISMTDSEAKQIAQVLWADAWASRNSHEVTVDAEHQALEPTDCIGVPVDGVVQRCRIVTSTDQIPTARQFSLVRDDDGSYESFAVADDPVVVPRPPIVYAPLEVLPLDIPLLRDADDAPGFYVATRSLLAGGFRSGAIYRSVDGGGNFTRMVSIGNEATVGELLEVVPAPGDYAVVDGVNHIRVRLQSGDLSSITRAAMLAGGAGSNAAAIGADGRWEIVQFQTVEQLTADVFLLTDLLRGRRGTEHALGSSVLADRFVLLTAAGIYRAPLQLAELGRPFIYRGVGNGTLLDAADNVPFTCRGVCLKPFSPVFVLGDRDPATGAWAVTWIRRGRVGKTLMDDAEIPLSEDLEDYEVVILDEDGGELRVISTTSPAAAYSAAQQVTDFGAVLDVLTVNVYQISAQVGRGYVGTATLTATEPLA